MILLTGGCVIHKDSRQSVLQDSMVTGALVEVTGDDDVPVAGLIAVEEDEGDDERTHQTTAATFQLLAVTPPCCLVAASLKVPVFGRDTASAEWEAAAVSTRYWSAQATEYTDVRLTMISAACACDHAWRLCCFHHCAAPYVIMAMSSSSSPSLCRSL